MKRKIHIVNPYGTLPNEGWRKYRTNIVAEYFNKYGYDVTYWISNIDHRSKNKRCEKDEIKVINENFRFRIVESPAYSANGSIGRIKYERAFGNRVKEMFFSEKLESNIIIITDPAIFYGEVIYDIAKKTKSKFFIDILDLWPEVFSTLFPQKIRWCADIILSPLYILRKKLYQKADGFLAVTNDYLNVAKKNCPKTPGEVVYIGLENIPQIPEDYILQKNNDEIWVIYAGTLGINYDIKTILEFAGKLENCEIKAKLLIAGDGPSKNKVEKFILDHQLQKTLFLGRINSNELNSLYLKCDIALSTYLESSTVSFPVKAFDYIAFGLPVINSLKREYGNLVASKKIGLQYQAEDVESLFNQFYKLATDKSFLLECKNNTVYLREAFNIEKQYEKYINFVENNN